MDDDYTESPFPTMGAGEHMNQDQFGDQASAGVGVFGSPGLQEAQQVANSRVPRTVAPSASGNGMSEGQYQQTLGGQMPTDNGIAKNQYNIAKFSMKAGE